MIAEGPHNRAYSDCFFIDVYIHEQASSSSPWTQSNSPSHRFYQGQPRLKKGTEVRTRKNGDRIQKKKAIKRKVTDHGDDDGGTLLGMQVRSLQVK